MNYDELAEQTAQKLLDSVDMDTIEQFFYDEHVRFYSDINNREQLERDAFNLGMLEESDV